MDSQNRFKTSLRLVTAALVLLAMMVALVASVGACGAEAKVYLNLMSAVPEDSGHFAYWATEDIDADPDLFDIYIKFKDSPEATQAKYLVKVLVRVKQAAKALSYENATEPTPVAVLRGEFDIQSVEDELEETGYSETIHKNVGIWSLENDQTANSIAIQHGTILIGNSAELKVYIDVTTKGNAQSLDEDPNIKMLTERLPNGVIVEIDRASPGRGEEYADLVAYGKSYAKASKDTLKLTAVYLFAHGPAAQEARDDIENYLEDRFERTKVERDDNFITATAQISISEFAQSLTF